ncbi:tetratricopeptide repeat protein [bacterium]|nr:tetratricopeptide repeat protein [bacterium]
MIRPKETCVAAVLVLGTLTLGCTGVETLYAEPLSAEVAGELGLLPGKAFAAENCKGVDLIAADTAVMEGWDLLDRGLTDQAEDTCNRALMVLPQDPLLHLVKARALQMRGNTDAAIEQFRQAASYAGQSYHLVVREFESVMTGFDSAIRFRYHLLAADMFDQLICIEDRSRVPLSAQEARWTTEIAKSDTPYARYRRASVRYRREDTAGARVDLERALESLPDEPVLLAFEAAYLYQVDADLDAALSVVDRVIEGAPGWAHAHGIRGDILIRSRRFEEAEAALSTCAKLLGDLRALGLECSPSSEAGTVLSRLIAVRHRLGRFQEALDTIEESAGVFGSAVWIGAANLEIFAPEARYYASMDSIYAAEPSDPIAAWVVARAADGESRFDPVEALERIVGQTSDFALGWSQLGFAYGQQGRERDALRCFEEGIRRASAQTASHRYLSQWYSERGDNARAAELSRMAIDRNPRDLLAWYWLGRAESSLGHFAEAARCYTVARRIWLASGGNRYPAQGDWCVWRRAEAMIADRNEELARRDLMLLRSSSRREDALATLLEIGGDLRPFWDDSDQLARPEQLLYALADNVPGFQRGDQIAVIRAQEWLARSKLVGRELDITAVLADVRILDHNGDHFDVGGQTGQIAYQEMVTNFAQIYSSRFGTVIINSEESATFRFDRLSEEVARRVLDREGTAVRCRGRIEGVTVLDEDTVDALFFWKKVVGDERPTSPVVYVELSDVEFAPDWYRD